MKSSELKPNRRILIVDDNPSIHSDFRKILAPSGPDKSAVHNLKAALFDRAPQAAPSGSKFDLDSAHQGQEALEMVKRSRAEGRPYAMAFVDVRMPPGWDGIETIARIWEVDPDLQVVVCTAYSDYSWEDMRAKVGQPDSLLVLKKPFDNIEVQQLAHALTQKWHLNLRSRLQMAELELANKSLLVSEERFSKAFHESPVPSGIQSLPDYRFVDVNARLVQITGYSRDELIGRTPAELFLWDAPALADQWYDSVAREVPVRDQAGKIRHQSGPAHEVLVSLSPVRLGDQPHILFNAQDVSERMLLERQLHQAQKMEAVGQLAAGVAHDFNNILTIIQGHAGIIKNQLNSGRPPTESADKIGKAASRATSLIRQLLMFSRKQVMQFRYLNLNESVNNSLAMVGRLVGEHIQIQFKAADSLPSIHADPTMMEQIIMNLAVNARDAMPNGGRVDLATELVSLEREPTPMDPERRAGQFIRLTFTDTGCGMDTTILNRIFEPFFTTKGVGKGTGLGLSTVFGIVRQHGGWIEVSSKPAQGTCFQIHFPACARPPEALVSHSDTAMLKRGKETILVAEDEEALRDMVSMVLSAQGYHVLTAASGVEALKVHEEANRPIDLLLTDMVMPGGVMGGELADRLRAVNPRLKVIYSSGYSPGMAGKDMSLLEGRNFLPKPYSIGKLAQFVRECLDATVKQNN